jgi:periplasmic protein TonB
MKKFYFIVLILVVCLNNIGAQNSVAVKDTSIGKFEKVEVEAEFPGGAKEWVKFLQKNLIGSTPFDNKARKGKYTVIVKFIVDREGSIYDVTAETHHGYGMENEVKRVIQIGPKWIPAMQNGKPVKALKRQPVTFLVE